MSIHPTRRMMNREFMETSDAITLGMPSVGRIEFKSPTPVAYQTFETILRCDAAEAPEERLLRPSLAHATLLEKLQAAIEVRKRYNAFDPNYPVSDNELLQAYCDGADAHAGLIALTSETDLSERAFESFKDWSLLAITAVGQAETRDAGILHHHKIHLTPAGLTDDPEFLAEIQEALPRLAQFERTKQYWNAAQNRDTKAIHEAFVGTDATRLNRAKALFYYAHYLPKEDTPLKVTCLEEAVAEIHSAITTGERPTEDDLVEIYEYFMLESLLGRAVHDIAWLEDQDTEDGRARHLSVQYLTNAADALRYVRHHLITTQQATERQIRQASADFDQIIAQDETLKAARETSDFLLAGKSDLHAAKGALFDMRNDPHDYPQKQSDLEAAEQRVATLQAKAASEQLDQKITEQTVVYTERRKQLTAVFEQVISNLRAKRQPIIGDIRPGAKGNQLAQLVVDIDQQINEATYFASMYGAENRDLAQREYNTIQQLGHSVIRLFEMIKDISPDEEFMDASPFRHALAQFAL